MQHPFSSNYDASTGVEVSEILLTVSDKRVRLMLWDTPGDSKAKMASEFRKDANGLLICFDTS